MDYNLIVKIVKEVMFEVFDENISDYDVDGLLLYCFEHLDGLNEEMDIEQLVKNAIHNWNLDGFI